MGIFQRSKSCFVMLLLVVVVNLMLVNLGMTELWLVDSGRCEELPDTAGDWQIEGDFRTAYSNDWRDTRSGDNTSMHEFGARLRVGLGTALTEQWHIQGRFATTFEDQGNNAEFFIRPQRQTATAVTPGTATLDELYLRWRSEDTSTQLQFGRFQSSLKLPLNMDRSLDRNQATNLNLGWTDGVQIKQQLAHGWQALLVGQYNDADGNGITTRAPLDFSDSSSRVSSYTALVNDQHWGPIIKRALAITWYPNALASDGTALEKREDYLAITLKMAALWQLTERIKLVLGGEVGQAVNTPKQSVMQVPGDADSSGFGWLWGFDLVDVLPHHTLGFGLGQADAGWLISNGLRQNDSLAEMRWNWHASSSLVMEFRARWRYEQQARIDAAQKQRDRDLRLRATWSF